MKIRRFVAKDMRTALVQIKEELGADAVIMSNKKIPEGVELMAAVDYSQASTPLASESASEDAVEPTPVQQTAVAQSQSEKNPVNQSNTLAGDTLSLSMTSHLSPENNAEQPSDSLSALLNRKIQHTATPTISTNSENTTKDDIEAQFKNFTDRLQQKTTDNDGSEVFMAADVGEEIQVANNSIETRGIEQRMPLNDTIKQNDVISMQNEMASIRQLLEHQLSGLMWQDMAQKDPSRALLVNRLMALGLTEQVSDQIAGYVPNNLNEQDAWQTALKLLSEQVNTTNNDIIHRGGVVALVGPTGVGKTTTIAKLAARFAQIHGADEVAMISTDSYRIAGFEQLVTYGRIIGCQVKLAQDAKSLDILLQQYSKKKLVLIDTAGMGQRDIRLAEHLTTLIANARVNIRNYLVLSANTQQRVMQENVERFRKVPLSGCIYTKIDESLSVGEIISTSIQNGLPIGYLTDGQRVPEDIKVANAVKLVTLADKMSAKLSGSHSINMTSMRPLSVNVA